MGEVVEGHGRGGFPVRVVDGGMGEGEGEGEGQMPLGGIAAGEGGIMCWAGEGSSV